MWGMVKGAALSALLALVALAGCSIGARNRAALAVSTAALACDWMQTRTVAGYGMNGEWGDYWEKNPLIGSRPDHRTIDFYFAGALFANTLTWVLMPERYRWAVPAVVTTTQAATIVGNGMALENSRHRDKVSGYACGI